jgi:hypothetical protein
MSRVMLQMDEARERQQQRDRDTKVAYENLLYSVLEKLNAQVVAETFRANDEAKQQLAPEIANVAEMQRSARSLAEMQQTMTSKLQQECSELLDGLGSLRNELPALQAQIGFQAHQLAAARLGLIQAVHQLENMQQRLRSTNADAPKTWQCGKDDKKQL